MTDHQHDITARPVDRTWEALVDGKPLLDLQGRARRFRSKEAALEAADMDGWLQDQDQPLRSSGEGR